MKKRIFKLTLLVTSLFSYGVANAGEEIIFNPLQTAVPSLSIAPDARGGGMGAVGAATSPDLNSQYLNPAKYAQMESNGGFAIAYTTWLRKRVNEIDLLSFAGSY